MNFDGMFIFKHSFTYMTYHLSNEVKIYQILKSINLTQRLQKLTCSRSSNIPAVVGRKSTSMQSNRNEVLKPVQI